MIIIIVSQTQGRVQRSNDYFWESRGADSFVPTSLLVCVCVSDISDWILSCITLDSDYIILAIALVSRKVFTIICSTVHVPVFFCLTRVHTPSAARCNRSYPPNMDMLCWITPRSLQNEFRRMSSIHVLVLLSFQQPTFQEITSK